VRDSTRRRPDPLRTEPLETVTVLRCRRVDLQRGGKCEVQVADRVGVEYPPQTVGIQSQDVLKRPLPEVTEVDVFVPRGVLMRHVCTIE
jgi:hypothetical protein